MLCMLESNSEIINGIKLEENTFILRFLMMRYYFMFIYLSLALYLDLLQLCTNIFQSQSVSIKNYIYMNCYTQWTVKISHLYRIMYNFVWLYLNHVCTDIFVHDARLIYNYILD